MPYTESKNDFLLELLALQQDGRHAISAPTNWTFKPLLEVETEIDEFINDLEGTILVGSNGNSTARWHFFIGSPGNGKSAAIGKLCRKLIDEKGCQVRDENDTQISELSPMEIPYALNIFEYDNSYVTVQIVQDASVVRNPFSSNVNPANELLLTLKNAWTKGISLIVCTNRGVLEKAHRDFHTDININTKPWFKILAAIITDGTANQGTIGDPRDFNGHRTAFREVKISYCHMDNRSLLSEERTFERLIQKATSAERWGSCDSCVYKENCPFFQNRKWLVHDMARTNVLRILRRAEVLSGQVIVFREALAIISLILAGCPKDYKNGHPCKWVSEAVACNNVFALGARRIYMCLLASDSPYGLEPTASIHNIQLDKLHQLYDVIGANMLESRAALKHVVESKPPSTDVGVTRLFGPIGVMASLDPCREALPSDFYDRWDVDSQIRLDEGLFSSIELTCVKTWQELESYLEHTSEITSPEIHWVLKRWSSNYLLRFGTLIEGRSAWSKELDAFDELLTLAATSPENRTLDQKRSIRQLDTQIESLLNMTSYQQNESAVQLSETVMLSGRWVSEKLKPKSAVNKESGSVSLTVEFDGGEQAVLGSLMYLWLTRRSDGKLDARCFPRELLSGAKDARVRAASKGKYAFESNDIELVVIGNDEIFRLTRFDGEVDVSHD